ncbi:unnamed protein product, partial [Meganyctiphanes norvegica]
MLESWLFITSLKGLKDECGPAGDWRVKASECFAREANDPQVLKKLPWINETPLHRLRPNQVVRFRGVIQDMFDNEFFLDTYEVRNKTTGSTKLRPGRYKDVTDCAAHEEVVVDSDNCQTGDRLTYYCIPIPGENQWVKEVYASENPCMSEASTSIIGSRQKRSAGDEDDIDTSKSNSNAQTKCSETDSMETESPSESAESKRIRTENITNAGSSTSATGSSTTPDLNFPIPGMKGTPCLVKIYDEQDLSLNDMIEVVGVLSMDPSLANNGVGSSGQGGVPEFGEMDMEEAAHSPPPSLVPRLHVLSIRKLKHINPLLPNDLSVNVEGIQSLVGEFRETRELLRSVLQQALMGDGLAAEMLICHLVSTIYLRQDVVALGKYSINLSGISGPLLKENYTTRLNTLLQTLVTQSHFLSMTLETMNKTKFVPKKDYNSNRLVSGLLQLPEHTHLVVDETALTAGQLDANGVGNLTALGNMINWQKLSYDFQFHQLENTTNVPVIILSEGKSMVKCDAEVRLNSTNTNVSAAFNKVEAALTPDVIKRIRCYLTVSRLMEYTLTEENQKSVQDDFVESRKNDNGMTAEDLSNLLTLARLVALSCGESKLTSDIWRSTKILETERKLRLPAATRPNVLGPSEA